MQTLLPPGDEQEATRSWVSIGFLTMPGAFTVKFGNPADTCRCLSVKSISYCTFPNKAEIIP